MLIFEQSRSGRYAAGQMAEKTEAKGIPVALQRKSRPALPEVSEMQVVRHYTRLSQKNYSIDTQFYPLGSCTMKYNPKTNERQASLTGFSGAHPLVPSELCQGALQLMYELEHHLAHVAGLDAVSVQPSAGAQGELAGMLLFSAYHRDQGKPRSKILIPDTAHGTNPATAVMCGFEVRNISTKETGRLTIEAFKEALGDGKDIAGKKLVIHGSIAGRHATDRHRGGNRLAIEWFDETLRLDQPF